MLLRVRTDSVVVSATLAAVVENSPARMKPQAERRQVAVVEVAVQAVEAVVKAATVKSNPTQFPVTTVVAAKAAPAEVVEEAAVSDSAVLLFLLVNTLLRLLSMAKNRPRL